MAFVVVAPDGNEVSDENGEDVDSDDGEDAFADCDWGWSCFAVWLLLSTMVK
jgi:hypothetical protein